MGKFDKLNWKMRGISLTGMQGLTLHYISVESQYWDVFPMNLEKFLEIKGSSVNILINNLEKNGYLRRGDGKYKKLILTNKTYAMKEEIVSRVSAYMKDMFEDISEDDLAVFDRVITKMAHNTRQ